MVERLERDEDQRRTLLNDVSHELRTPLSVIAGNLEAMIDGVHPADEAHLTAILEETRVMERLIDDLRTVALSEAGTLPLHREPTDLDLLVVEVVRSFAGAAGTAGVTVTADVPVDLPILDVDPVRIREVLSNLVANGVRHTPSGGSVVVRGEVTGDRVVLRVIDTGPGIDPDLLPHVFDRFAKGAGSTGSGLGLAIARHLVAAHGGDLDVEATGSAGTTFRATPADLKSVVRTRTTSCEDDGLTGSSRTEDIDKTLAVVEREGKVGVPMASVGHARRGRRCVVNHPACSMQSRSGDAAIDRGGAARSVSSTDAAADRSVARPERRRHR